jgi:hypothetical protein
MVPFTFDLLPELWLVIFNPLLEPMAAPYKDCTPETFICYRTNNTLPRTSTRIMPQTISSGIKHGGTTALIAAHGQIYSGRSPSWT